MIGEILYILAIVIIGALTINLFNFRITFFEKMGLSFILGIGLYTYSIFISQFVFGIEFTKQLFVQLATLLITILVLINRKKIFRFKVVVKIRKPINLVELSLFMVLASLVIYSFINSIYWPITDWDSLALYDFRARILLHEKLLVNVSDLGYFFQYPLMTTLSHLGVYLFGGSNPKYLYSIFYLAFLLIFYGSLRRKVSRQNALLFTTAVASFGGLFYHSMMAYTNLPFLIYIVSGLIYIFDCLVSKDGLYFVLVALLVGLSTWVRTTDQLWIVPMLISVALFITKKQYRYVFLGSLTFLLIRQPWLVYLRTINFNTGLGEIGMYSIPFILNHIDVKQIVVVVKFLYKNIILSWGVSTIVFVFSILFSLNLKDKYLFLFLGVIIANIAYIFVGTYVFSIYYDKWYLIPDSARRMSFYLVPLMLFYSSLVYEKRMLMNYKK